jgi:hypothetical protein
MKKNFINRTHVEGYLYQHTLEEKVTGPNSKNPGTKYISGNIDIATDDEMLNIVSVHYSYSTPTTSTGKANTSYAILADIISGKYGTVMANGADQAVKLRIDSAFDLNEFYSDKNGTEELVSVKRNEGGFIHLTNELNADVNARNTFDCDMIITGVREVEADEEKNLPAKAVIKGCIFSFRNAMLPVEFSAVAPGAINYFLGLDASSSNPVFTRIKGNQISNTITRTIEEESAFGEASVRTVSSTRKDSVVNWAAKDTYVWDDESTITAAEFKKIISEREVYLATLKQNNDEYKAKKAQAGNALATPTAAPASSTEFNF